jgi:ribosomal protein S18 acetylase RimI-like enzyme
MGRVGRLPWLRRDVAEHPLDNAVWASLSGAHAAFAERRGQAARYLPDVAPFAALPLQPDAAAWADLAEVVGAGGDVVLPGPWRVPPAGWEVQMQLDGVQLDGAALEVRPDPEAVLLGPEDVPEMLALVARTEPGPFLPRTRLMGTYLGIRREGALVAMAGERLRPPGWSEISAVCTDAGYAGQGLATRLVRAVGAVIRDRGDVPFLHASAANTRAIGLYEHLGFVLRTRTWFVQMRTPGVQESRVAAG